MSEFLNSKFGLALFSAIVLTFLPWAYKSYLLSYEIAKTKSFNNYRIEAEIDHRLFYIQAVSEEMEQYERNDAILAFYGTETEIGSGRYYNFKPAFKIFAGASLLQLIINYSSSNACIQSKEYSELRNGIDNFRKDFLSKLGQYKDQPLSHEFATKGQKLLLNLQLSWAVLKNEC